MARSIEAGSTLSASTETGSPVIFEYKRSRDEKRHQPRACLLDWLI